jgi:cellulose synthase (UDP-forming)
MIFGDSASWEAIRARRNKNMPLMVGMFYVVKLSFTSIAATLRALAEEPARQKRAQAREQDVVVVDSAPAHLLAFGEAFDPPPAERPISMLQAAIAQQGTPGRQAGSAYAPPTSSPEGLH